MAILLYCTCDIDINHYIRCIVYTHKENWRIQNEGEKATRSLSQNIQLLVDIIRTDDTYVREKKDKESYPFFIFGDDLQNSCPFAPL